MGKEVSIKLYTSPDSFKNGEVPKNVYRSADSIIYVCEKEKKQSFQYAKKMAQNIIEIVDSEKCIFVSCINSNNFKDDDKD